MTRKKQLWLLIIASAFTAIAQYPLQGILAMGESPESLPHWFKTAEAILWAPRAIVESMVIVYLFQTTTDDKAQKRKLAFFEFSLIVLIALTLGPALRTTGLGLPMSESLKEPWFTLWSFGVACYAPLMMAGAASAYRAQPGEQEPAMLGMLSTQVEQLKAQLNQRSQLQSQVDAILAQKLSKFDTAREVWQLSGNGTGVLTAQEVANFAKCSLTTARNAQQKENHG